MAFARFGHDSDVYVYASTDGGVECCGCHLHGERSFPSFFDADSLLAHLNDHIEAGHRVPVEILDPDLYEPSDFDHGWNRPPSRPGPDRSATTAPPKSPRTH